jgi:ubiquinone biosynthesis protein COQ9
MSDQGDDDQGDEQQGDQQQGDWAARAEQDFLEAALRLASRVGWSDRLARQAGREIGLSAPETELLLPEGARDLAALFSGRLDAEMVAALGRQNPPPSRIREKIRAGVLAWLCAAMTDEAAVRRWMGFLALPGNAALGLRLAWARADALWRWAGDAATDENHYTKRLLLAEIFMSTLAVRLALGQARAEDHLEGRIGGVMSFERWKAGTPRPADMAERAAAWLGRLRYGRGTPGYGEDSGAADVGPREAAASAPERLPR